MTMSLGPVMLDVEGPALSAVELLALVIGSGSGGKSSLDLAQQVLARNGGSLRRLD